MAVPHIPAIVKHCTVAIWHRGRPAGKDQKDRFMQCFEIAKAQLTKFGFITVGAAPDDIGLTPRGRVRDQLHKSEGPAKTTLFDALYDQLDISGAKAKKAEEAKAPKKQEEVAKTPQKIRDAKVPEGVLLPPRPFKKGEI